MSESHQPRPFILVVEDEALVRSCTVHELEDAGYAVIDAADAEEALAEFQNHLDVTIVFTDVNMPGRFDGLALVQKIFQMCPRVQLILTSGRGAPTQSEMPAGARFLPKPYSGQQLNAMILAG